MIHMKQGCFVGLFGDVFNQVKEGGNGSWVENLIINSLWPNRCYPNDICKVIVLDGILLK